MLALRSQLNQHFPGSGRETCLQASQHRFCPGLFFGCSIYTLNDLITDFQANPPGAKCSLVVMFTRACLQLLAMVASLPGARAGIRRAVALAHRIALGTSPSLLRDATLCFSRSTNPRPAFGGQNCTGASSQSCTLPDCQNTQSSAHPRARSLFARAVLFSNALLATLAICLRVWRGS